jgi:hypothetical protein
MISWIASSLGCMLTVPSLSSHRDRFFTHLSEFFCIVFVISENLLLSGFQTWAQYSWYGCSGEKQRFGLGVRLMGRPLAYHSCSLRPDPWHRKKKIQRLLWTQWCFCVCFLLSHLSDVIHHSCSAYSKHRFILLFIWLAIRTCFTWFLFYYVYFESIFVFIS